jgi:hypothetical protein
VSAIQDRRADEIRRSFDFAAQSAGNSRSPDGASLVQAMLAAISPSVKPWARVPDDDNPPSPPCFGVRARSIGIHAIFIPA